MGGGQSIRVPEVGDAAAFVEISAFARKFLRIHSRTLTPPASGEDARLRARNRSR
jgi:hypothetical protein